MIDGKLLILSVNLLTRACSFLVKCQPSAYSGNFSAFARLKLPCFWSYPWAWPQGVAYLRQIIGHQSNFGYLGSALTIPPQLLGLWSKLETQPNRLLPTLGPAQIAFWASKSLGWLRLSDWSLQNEVALLLQCNCSGGFQDTHDLSRCYFTHFHKLKTVLWFLFMAQGVQLKSLNGLQATQIFSTIYHYVIVLFPVAAYDLSLVKTLTHLIYVMIAFSFPLAPQSSTRLLQLLVRRWTRVF